jgi:hypothetical protein
MTWEYCIEEIEIGVAEDDIEKAESQFNELGGGEWEAVTSWREFTSDPYGKVYVLFKKPKSK